MSTVSAPAAVHESFDPRLFEMLFEAERRHFWFKARNQAIAVVARDAARHFGPRAKILEVGCGTGNVLPVLEGACPGAFVVGMDLFVEGLQFARRRTRCGLVQADLAQAPFATSFDMIGMFDVVEHIPDDRRVLLDAYRALRPGGVLLVTVPAGRHLWSYFDEAAGHCRRYTADDLREKLTAAGFIIDYVTYFMMGLVPLVWLARRLARFRMARGKSVDDRQRALVRGELEINSIVNGVLARVVGWEAAAVAARWHLKGGTSLLAVARRPASA